MHGSRWPRPRASSSRRRRASSCTTPPRGRVVWRCPWDRLREIVAWKDDLYIHDRISIGLRIEDEPNDFRVDEDQQGWDDLLTTLEKRFGIPPDRFWSRIVQPPFARNWTVLWGAAGACPECGYDLRATPARCPECGTPVRRL